MRRPDSNAGRPSPGRPATSAPLEALDVPTVTDIATWRQRHAWARAVLWLHDHSLPAAAPIDLARWLHRRGAGADWYHRGAP